MLVKFTVARVDRRGVELEFHSFTTEVDQVILDTEYPDATVDSEWFWANFSQQANPWSELIEQFDIDILGYELLEKETA